MRRLLALFALLTSALVVAPGAAADDMPCMGTLPPGTYENVDVVVPPGHTCIMTGVTVFGNVKALEDSRLRINDSNVRGNVLGEKADTVEVIRSRVRENIIIKEGGPALPPIPTGFSTCVAGNPCVAQVVFTTVEEGNVLVEKMRGTVDIEFSGTLNPIRGNVQVKENVAAAGEAIFVSGNGVAQNMQVEDNLVARLGPPVGPHPGGLTVQNNTVPGGIQENLQVFKNKGPGGKAVSNNRVGESLQCFDNDPPFVGTVGNVAREAQGQCTAAPLP